MSMTEATRAMSRGIRRSLYASATADTTRLRQMRRQISTTDQVAVAFNTVGRAIRTSMDTVDRNTRENSSRKES